MLHIYCIGEEMCGWAFFPTIVMRVKYFTFYGFFWCDDISECNSFIFLYLLKNKLLGWNKTKHIYPYIWFIRYLIFPSSHPLVEYNITSAEEVFRSGSCGNVQPLLETILSLSQWLKCCATNRKVAGSIPTGVSGFFIDIKSFRSHYDTGVDSPSNINEHQEYFLGVKAAGA